MQEQLELHRWLLEEAGSILLVGELEERNAERILAELVIAENENASRSETQQKPLFFYIDCQGGSLLEAFAIADLMRSMKTRIITMALGACQSAAVLLCAAGHERFALPNTRFLLHPLFASCQARLDEIEAQAKELQVLQDRYIQLLSELTGTEQEKLSKLCRKESFLSAEEAKQLNIIDQILIGR